MSALIILALPRDKLRDKILNRATASMTRQGFRPPQTIECSDILLCWFPSKHQDVEIGIVRGNDTDFIACVGTFFFDDLVGETALKQFLAHFTEQKAQSLRKRTDGNFLLFIKHQSGSWLLSDRVGLIKLYSVSTLSLFSTSWLAAYDCLDSPSLNDFAAQEYILQGANHGRDTPIDQIQICDPASIYRADGSIVVTERATDWLRIATLTHYDDAVDSAASILQKSLRRVDAQYHSRIRCSLSGGFDSRLVVAALTSIGSRPDCFVYGSSAMQDVQIAKQVAAVKGIALKHVDKEILNGSFSELAEAHIEDNIDFFDGIPIDGIFDRGADRTTRIDQSSQGRIALNGGGGEILRNFFYIPDRRFTAKDILGIFYHQFSPGVFRSRQTYESYCSFMIHSLERLTGSGKLERDMVDLIYPLFRTRYWVGRNNSMAARVGGFLTPLLTPALVELAAALPVAWRRYGRFESSLITRLDSPLGDLELLYGFSPRAGPSPQYRATQRIQEWRPVWLRRQAAHIKRLIGRNTDQAPLDSYRALLPAPYAIDRIIRLAEIRDPDQLARAMTLESLLRRRRHAY